MIYLVLSDIHGNLDALQAVLRDAGRFDRILFLGDIVDYGPQPNECIDLLKRHKTVWLIGNHDMVQTGDIDIMHMHEDARRCSSWTSLHLTKKNKAWLKQQKPMRIKSEFTLVHGSPSEPAIDYINSMQKADLIFNKFEFDILLHGHSHVPVLFIQNEGFAYGPSLDDVHADLTDKRVIINPGSVGQPRDGDERAAYGLLVDSSFHWKRVEYDISSVQKKIREAGLPESQAERLMYGN